MWVGYKLIIMEWMRIQIFASAQGFKTDVDPEGPNSGDTRWHASVRIPLVEAVSGVKPHKVEEEDSDAEQKDEMAWLGGIVICQELIIEKI